MSLIPYDGPLARAVYVALRCHRGDHVWASELQDPHETCARCGTTQPRPEPPDITYDDQYRQHLRY